MGKFYPVRGGVEKVMYDLMLGLSDRGMQCDMLCASTEGYPSGTLVINKRAKVMVMPTTVKAASTMIAPKMISKLRQIAHRYDVIHVHHPDPMASLALFLSGYKGKVVLHWHSDVIKQKVLLKFFEPLQSWVIKRADLIVGTTPVYVEQSPFLKKVQHKVDYIPIGVEPVLVNKEKVQAFRQKYRDKKIVFSLGRLVDYKGYAYLIQAAKHLDRGYQVLIGGKGPLHDSLQELILKQGVEDRVKLIGFIADEDVPTYYGACALFCLPSVWKTEAFGIVQIEAMSCGKPVISTHIPDSGVSWVNAEGQSGLVVDVKNPEALAEAIKRIAEHPQHMGRLSAGSLARYETHFTREKMINKCLEVYARVGLDTRKVEKG